MKVTIATVIFGCILSNVVYADDSKICPATVSSLGTQLALGKLKRDDFYIADNGRSSIIEIKNTLGGSHGKLNATQIEDCKQRLLEFEQYRKERVSEMSGTKNQRQKASSSCDQFYPGRVVAGKIYNPYYVGHAKVLGVGNGKVSIENVNSGSTDELSCDRLIVLMNE